MQLFFSPNIYCCHNHLGRNMSTQMNLSCGCFSVDSTIALSRENFISHTRTRICINSFLILLHYSNYGVWFKGKTHLRNMALFRHTSVSSTYSGPSVRPSSSIILSDFHSVSVHETTESVETSLWWPTWWLIWRPTWRCTWWPTWRWTRWPTRRQTWWPTCLLSGPNGHWASTTQVICDMSHICQRFEFGH